MVKLAYYRTCQESVVSVEYVFEHRCMFWLNLDKLRESYDIFPAYGFPKPKCVCQLDIFGEFSVRKMQDGFKLFYSTRTRNSNLAR